ncbi:MAG: flavohemoglobin expression-modulating QEGLA motif protein [Bacteroidales bacterium]|nr:flavohemoglobin expression-modulating QEGLA motif protein [Bacteroidales bacterium]
MKPDLSVGDIISAIQAGKTFETLSACGSFYVKIEDYVPYACFAIHNGHRLRPELKEKCLLTDHERWQEEDPHTHDMISSLPLVISAVDSRYEYDLNRNADNALYETAWGKKVWKEPLTEEQKEGSLEKHSDFYRIVHTLISTLEAKFGSVLVFDIHSFNYRRIREDAPVFNLGTELIRNASHRKYIDHWLSRLRKFRLPNIDVTVAENDIFSGRGYLLSFITSGFSNTLVLATEIKKVYCDEVSGESYPLIIEKLAGHFKEGILNTAAFFTRHNTSMVFHKNNKLLSSQPEKDLLKVDKRLFSVARAFEILNYVNPVNIEQARKDFFKSKYKRNPSFKYKQLSINPFEFKRELYNIPVEDIHDISIRKLYQDVIDSYADKVDIIASIGTGRFLYNSLRYFGEPGVDDIDNAHYLMHCSTSADKPEILNLDAGEVARYFKTEIARYGFDCRIEITRNIIAKVLILNTRKTIRIRKDAMFSGKSLHALSEHEVGVHMLTTINARLHPLNVFRLGTPLNTHTQEGLAILSEYLSGNMSIKRLQVLALRVLVIDMMLRGYDFSRSFHAIMDTGELTETQAFYITARIFRGGGFTKDYLYLNGFRDVLKYYGKNHDFINLLVGKTSIQYQNLINEMIDRKLISAPHFKTRSFIKPVDPDPIIEYILSGLK